MVVNSKIRDSDWLTFTLTIVNFNYVFIQQAPDLIESIEKRALRIIYPDVLSYEDVLICTGLETLATRRHNSCTKFISRLRSEKDDYNPLACIIRRQESLTADSFSKYRINDIPNKVRILLRFYTI